MNPRRCSAAFTLIELAMTALLLSMGLLTVFALLRRGIASRSELEGEMRGAAFADAAFNTLRAVSEHSARHADTNDLWTLFWTDFQNGETNVALTADADGQSSDSAAEPATGPAKDPTRLFGDGEVRVYRWLPDPAISNAVPPLRYQCSIYITNSFEEAKSVGLFLNHPTNRVQLTLHVWPSGQTNSAAQTYFTLFSNRGRLP